MPVLLWEASTAFNPELMNMIEPMSGDDGSHGDFKSKKCQWGKPEVEDGHG
jgi:hypothetical protein